MNSASAAQVSAKPPSVAGRWPPNTEYRAPPIPMPRSAIARMRPNVYDEPPSSGASMRYQTSSISRNAKPTTPAATGGNHESAAGKGAGASSATRGAAAGSVTTGDGAGGGGA